MATTKNKSKTDIIAEAFKDLGGEATLEQITKYARDKYDVREIAKSMDYSQKPAYKESRPPPPRPESGLTKVDDARRAVRQLGESASEPDIKSFARTKFGIELTHPTITTARTHVRDEVRKKNALDNIVPLPETPTVPTKPEDAVPGRGDGIGPRALPSTGTGLPPLPEPALKNEDRPAVAATDFTQLLKVKQLATEVGGIARLDELVGVLKEAQVK